jgi:N-acetylmuramoyl-L-alanine amidase
MARYPGAAFHGPVPNMHAGGNHPRLFVLHIMEGSLSGTDAWFHNPQAQASSNFGNGRGGLLYQWVDTADEAWAQAAYNNAAISVEHEGNTGDSLTEAQLNNDAHLLAWAHQVHGIPLRVTDDPASSGVIGHGLLGVAGGNHPDCPGTPVLDQRQEIVDRAIALLTPAPTPLPPLKENEMLYQLTGFNGPAVAMFDPHSKLIWDVADGTSATSWAAAQGVVKVTITAAEHAAIVAACSAS